MAEKSNCTQESTPSTIVEEVDSPNQSVSTVRILKLRTSKPHKHVKWNEGTVDNEHMNKKKSKCCCIYKKPKQRFDESSSDTDDECENCYGHVEVKKQKRHENQQQLQENGVPSAGTNGVSSNDKVNGDSCHECSSSNRQSSSKFKSIKLAD